MGVMRNRNRKIQVNGSSKSSYFAKVFLKYRRKNNRMVLHWRTNGATIGAEQAPWQPKLGAMMIKKVFDS